MSYRRQSRELVLQFLYGFDLNRTDLERALQVFPGWGRANSEVDKFARELMVGTVTHLEEMDKLISGHTPNWNMDRIALVDKCILRLALYELYFRDDIPPLATINEAIEIAKKFSTDRSGSFINGILDKINKEREED